MIRFLLSLFALVTIVAAECPAKPEVEGAYICRYGYRTSGGVRTDWAKYCCIDGDQVVGNDTIYCTNSEGWTKPYGNCGVSKCGKHTPSTAPFRQPTYGVTFSHSSNMHVKYVLFCYTVTM